MLSQMLSEVLANPHALTYIVLVHLSIYFQAEKRYFWSLSVPASKLFTSPKWSWPGCLYYLVCLYSAKLDMLFSFNLLAVYLELKDTNCRWAGKTSHVDLAPEHVCKGTHLKHLIKAHKNHFKTCFRASNILRGFGRLSLALEHVWC